MDTFFVKRQKKHDFSFFRPKKRLTSRKKCVIVLERLTEP